MYSKSIDLATGRTVARTVVATIVGTGIKHLITVTVDTDGPGGDQIGQVTATDGHPFFVVSPHPAAGPNLANGTWTLARDLHPGDLLRTPAGTTVTVLAGATTTATQTVYNLTVDTTHTYNVEASRTPVLVHNDDCFSTTERTVGHLEKMRPMHGLLEEKSAKLRGLTDHDLLRTVDDRLLVPFTGNSYASYQIKPNGNAVFKTILVRK